jgi:hypothetical protein
VPLGVPQTPRSAAGLAAALVNRPRNGATVTLRTGGDTLDLGELACTPGMRCRAVVTVRRARGRGARTAQSTMLAKGTTTVGPGPTTVTARLTAAGRTALKPARSARKVRTIVTIALTENTTRVGVRLVLTLRRGARR